MACLDGAEVSLVASAGVLTKRCGAFGRAGAGHVREDEGEGDGRFGVLGGVHGVLKAKSFDATFAKFALSFAK
jgi:hypothetical protein